MVPIIIQIVATSKQPNFFKLDEGAFPVAETNILKCYRNDLKFTDSASDWKNANEKAISNGNRMCAT